MPKFYYKARAKDRSLVQGDIIAGDLWLARKALSAQNLAVLEIQSFGICALLTLMREFLIKISGRVSPEDKLMFVNQLEAGVSIGIPVFQILDFVQKQVSNKSFKICLAQVTRDLSQGSTLHGAMEKFPDVFDSVSIALVRAGELSGELEATLGRLALIMEKRIENQAKVKSATLYPKIVLIFMGISMLSLVYFVVPKFKTFLSSLGQELPLATRALVNISDFFVSYWYAVGAAAAAAVVMFQRYAATERGTLKIDEIKLKLPVLGLLFMELELTNYCVLLELLLSSGMTLFESFATLKTTQNNQVIKNEIDRCSNLISSGGSLAQGLQSSTVLPLAFVSMVSIGEEAGKLPRVLSKLAKYYDTQADYRLKNIAKLIEPILLAVIFLGVGLIALAVFLPVWKMSSAIRSQVQ